MTTAHTAPARAGAAGDPPAASPLRWWALAALAAAQLTLVMEMNLVPVALPSVQRELGLTGAERALVVSAYTLAFGLLFLPAGRLSERLGRRRAFVTGLAGFGAASLLTGTADGSGELLVLRALQGAFGALALAPASMALLARTFPDPRERVTAIGVFTAVAGGGGGLGVLFGGLLTEHASWRWCMYGLAPLAAFAVAVALYAIPADEPAGPRTTGPLLPLRVLRDRTRAGVFLAVFAANIGTFGGFTVISYTLQEGAGWSPTGAGLAILPLAAVVVANSVFGAPLLLRTLTPKALLASGTALVAAATAWLAAAGPGTPYATGVLPSVLLMGFGITWIMISANGTLAQRTGPRDMATAGGMVNITTQLGGAVGVPLMLGLDTRTGALTAGALIAAAAVLVAFLVDAPRLRGKEGGGGGGH
ncbi:MFS transporter [Streptomyces sp. SID5770]|uniref:MFS transporter n=1 Tax=unclassified Streptomyces TaxID=2593676 RepID=UPI001370288A|nr:MFS transporter [Streptomyces sp. SID5770]MZE50097.1 MFS transporter [Streptomyces sp. SID5770]